VAVKQPARLDWEKAGGVAMAWLFFVAFVTYCAVRFRLRAFPAIVGSFLVASYGLAAVSIAAALPFFDGPRLWDSEFLAMDAMLGIDHLAFFRWLATMPWAMRTLQFFYFMTLPLIMLAPVLIAALGRYDRLHEFLWLFVWTLAAVTIVAAFVPARGLFSGLGLTQEMRDLLPSTAGDFHIAFIDRLIAGQIERYDMTSNPGATVFPSFHLCMAFILAWVFRGMPVLGAISTVIAGTIVVSIVPIGGHYVVDGIASVPIVMIAAAVYRVLAGANVDAVATRRAPTTNLRPTSLTLSGTSAPPRG
jgi:hypothetical protein